MTTQAEWEIEHYDRGVDKFFFDEADARKSGRMNETTVGTSVMKQRVLGVSQAIQAIVDAPSRGIGGAYSRVLRVAATRYDGKEFYHDYDRVAYIALLTLLQSAYINKKGAMYVTKVAREIGTRLENDLRLYVYRQDNAAFVGVIETSLKKQAVTSYRHKLRTFQKKWRDNKTSWDDWGAVKQVQVGVRVLRAILTEMDDCFFLTKQWDGKNLRRAIDTTIDFDDFVISETDMISRTLATNQPCIEQPVDWKYQDGEITGGFHTSILRKLNPFIKTRGEAHAEAVRASTPHKHIRAINHMQRTAWRINQPVVDAVKKYMDLGLDIGDLPKGKVDLPVHPGDGADEDDIRNWMVDAKRIHGINKKNARDKINLSQTMQMVQRLGDRKFWFTYTADFRGRVYCASQTLSPQSADHIKAMMQFGEGKPYGRTGIKWLAIHGANKYGYDKATYNDRIRWVIAHESLISEIVGAESSSRAISWLRGADKPFQFLAWAYAWAEASFGRDPTATGTLPIGLDGSCNGLQHFSALLRDEKGGRSVNLVDSELPADIYQDVADQLTQVLHRSPEPLAQKINTIGFDRKLTKRPVMTLVYGSTQQSCRAYSRQYFQDNSVKFAVADDDKAQWALATAVTPPLWEAIGEATPAARAAMTWLQKIASIIAREGQYAYWRSPVEFPVYQHYAECEIHRIQTDLFGRLELSVQGSPKAPAKVRARNSVAPNFVHSMDASHMVMTILAAERVEIDNLAMIHDDFGTHAADTEQLYHLIRQTFVELYAGTDWLGMWRNAMQALVPDVKLPEPPEFGTLEIEEVLDSTYFFG